MGYRSLAAMLALYVAALCVAAIGWAPWPAEADEMTADEKLVFLNCGRCHVIGPRNRTGGIGSTPSFAVIRTWENWRAKMEGFYALNPHPAFTQIEGITEPFPPERPSPIAPIELTEGELARIVAYAQTVEPAELGAEIGSR